LKRDVERGDIKAVALLVKVSDTTYQVVLKQSYALVLLDMAERYSEDGVLKLVELDEIDLKEA
jgi:hypothetical protein